MQIKFLVLAMLTVLFMALIGIMIAENNILLATLSALGAISTIGYAFVSKAKKRKNLSSER